MKVIEDGIKGAAASKAVRGPLGQITSYTGFTENDVNQAIAQAKIDLAQNIAAHWSKYGSGAQMAQLASQAWRSYAFNNHIITWQEMNDGEPVLSPQPMKKGQQERKRESTPEAKDMVFNASEVQEGRSILLRWTKMSDEQRRAWLGDNPRRAPLLHHLMDQSKPKAK